MGRAVSEMLPRYEPHGVEERWQETWEAEGLYNADPDPSRTPFVDRAPAAQRDRRPAHSGTRCSSSLGDTDRPHAADAGLQRRSSSRATTTPASRRRTSSRSSCSARARRARISAARRSRSASGSGCTSTAARSCCQFRRIGASLDYRRERFTMDDAYVRAVMRFFVHLWDKGWIYRANRIVNWCPYHLTSLSDLELEHEDVDDALTYVRYPLRRRRRAHHDRDGAARDDPRRRRGRGASGRRALPRR